MHRATPSAGVREAADESLMARYADGDIESFGELFRRCEPRIYAFFLRRTGSPERAEDLYQELFLRVHRARDAYDPERPFAPWLFQIAHRLLVDDQRRAWRTHEIPLEDREPREMSAGSDDRLADRERLRTVLDALSADERYVLFSSRLEGIAYPELSARLGKSAEAVRQMASRATRRLRAAIASPTGPVGAHSR